MANEKPDEAVRIRTLADLARLAGVSAGTVSRALAGSALVKPKTRDHIRELARRHGFRPNQMASKLRSRRTGVIGVVIPLGHEQRQHISDPFFMTLLGALADELTERGYDLMLRRAIPDRNGDWLQGMTGSGMVDGVVVIGQSDQYDLIEQVAATYRPMVAWGHYRPGQLHCVVGTDNFAGGQMAVRHLLASGARRLLFLGDATGIEIAARLEGARDAAVHAGASIRHLPVALSLDAMDASIGGVLDGEQQPFDGIFAASDLIAAAVLRELKSRNVKVPETVRIVGFDDLPLAEHTMPPMTTIRQEIGHGARAIVERLMRLIQGETAESLQMKPALIVRGTSVEAPRPN